MQGQEDGDSILPFAKCSRVVSRFSPCSLPPQNRRPMPQPYGDAFWENLSQRSSSNWMVEQYIPPILRATDCSRPSLHPLEGLPPPEKLWRRKRKKLHLERMQKGPGSIPARVRAVTYHLEDLRRRQGIINELKRAQWGSSDATPELPALEEGFELLSTTKYFDVEEERATYPQKETYSVTPRDQLLWTPWTPVGQQGTYASGQLSSLTYSTATARKNPVYDPQAMELESEE
ncbi:protein INCA1 isoform 1 [Mus musculus]|uniref:Protein INCA1 n=2 Tax=Mus musculus TaxID=10090 RepID=INCA1_MOUSE|nr:protein INCA1 isoform 1 [Mus musculus]NP_001239412.1 protein INCA1 isoform 1 [Mus musculus]NP_001239413.1 protein INCA1 isoform 1 [Mus musculus]NP_001406019.1 protein INCA1 isoform 1 [Mus musculus]NP_001406020.1 protein INCA1 isoform 1 [Mus musculus]NP_001406021.1 protein INCA1 isoform 1 [Mus musculus]NP_001406022.1 protein INCA1 isoform 1 [Mus musculus]NP_998894.1 protein INCA1 isoform 1 [Mus musculus]Q6PKN7.1 RecName: Full=Protein INCA1; AltName: Full=Inhibitor of CDK interacting with |eukprot:NP_001239411.1 protein INCA1 isoform 1 [Mus musculus]